MSLDFAIVSGLVSANEVLDGIKGGYKVLPTCQPVRQTAKNVPELAAKGIVQATKVGAVHEVFKDTKTTSFKYYYKVLGVKGYS